jgi:hypothetical protein
VILVSHQALLVVHFQYLSTITPAFYLAFILSFFYVIYNSIIL